jgi:hypothetical protein
MSDIQHVESHNNPQDTCSLQVGSQNVSDHVDEWLTALCFTSLFDMYRWLGAPKQHVRWLASASCQN